MKPLVAAVPSDVTDTNDFLKKFRDISSLPSGAIMVTIDVVGLYPHIPHDKGLQSIREALNNRENLEIPTETIVDLAELVLKNNNFEFNEKHYLQTLGTASGTQKGIALCEFIYGQTGEKVVIPGAGKTLHLVTIHGSPINLCIITSAV